MRVLLLSAYDADSHQCWREVLVAALAEFSWTVLSLPPRYFSWRIRGNSLSWAFGQRDLLERDYDLLIVTSMVDLSALRGFVPSLAKCPTLVYFHENQFAYPDSGKQFSSIEPQILNLYTALAADHVAFNSAYNRDTFLQGAEQLLGKMPDQVPEGIVERIRVRSQVLPVPLPAASFEAPGGRAVAKPDSPLHIVWNHRWEYDKAPERFFAAINLLLEQGRDIRLSVVGQRFRQAPDVFDEMEALLRSDYPAVIAHWGYLKNREEYQQLLEHADVVVSTALHDFQGLAVLEAVAAGCVALVPDRLCYGEWFPQQCRYPSYLQDASREAQGLAAALVDLGERKRAAQFPTATVLTGLSIETLVQRYRELLLALVETGGPT